VRVGVACKCCVVFLSGILQYGVIISVFMNTFPSFLSFALFVKGSNSI